MKVVASLLVFVLFVIWGSLLDKYRTDYQNNLNSINVSITSLENSIKLKAQSVPYIVKVLKTYNVEQDKLDTLTQIHRYITTATNTKDIVAGDDALNSAIAEVDRVEYYRDEKFLFWMNRNAHYTLKIIYSKNDLSNKIDGYNKHLQTFPLNIFNQIFHFEIPNPIKE